MADVARPPEQPHPVRHHTGFEAHDDERAPRVGPLPFHRREQAVGPLRIHVVHREPGARTTRQVRPPPPPPPRHRRLLAPPPHRPRFANPQSGPRPAPPGPRPVTPAPGALPPRPPAQTTAAR